MRAVVSLEGEVGQVRGVETVDLGLVVFVLGDINVPRAAGEWLGRIDLAGPGENLRQQRRHAGSLVRWLQFGLGVVAAAGVVRLVPYIPAEDAVVFGESADNPLHIGFEARNLGRIGERFGAGTLYPSRVMHSRNRIVLFPQSLCRIPAGIKQNQQRSELMARSDRQKLIE